jgi:hypothetical protein
VILTWSPKRRSLTRRFGVLVLEHSSVTLFDRDETILLSGGAATMTASPALKTKVELTGPGGGPFYLVGLSGQEARRSKLARRLTARYNAVAAPANVTSMSDRSWKRATAGSNPYTTGTDQITQHLVWRPVLLELLWRPGVQRPTGSSLPSEAAPTREAGEDQPSDGSPEHDRPRRNTRSGRPGIRTFAAWPVLLAAAYAIVWLLGWLWPQHPAAAVVVSIGVSLLAWVGTAVVLSSAVSRGGGWWAAATVPAFAFLMVGAASFGPASAEGAHSAAVRAEVTSVRAAHHDGGGRSGSYTVTTYRFARVGGPPIRGTVQYRGDRGAYHLHQGDRTRLLVDPRGKLPLDLASETDPGDNAGEMVLGGVWFSLIWLIVHGWAYRRRRKAAGGRRPDVAGKR